MVMEQWVRGAVEGAMVGAMEGPFRLRQWLSGRIVREAKQPAFHCTVGPPAPPPSFPGPPPSPPPFPGAPQQGPHLWWLQRHIVVAEEGLGTQGEAAERPRVMPPACVCVMWVIPQCQCPSSDDVSAFSLRCKDGVDECVDGLEQALVAALANGGVVVLRLVLPPGRDRRYIRLS